MRDPKNDALAEIEQEINELAKRIEPEPNWKDRVLGFCIGYLFSLGVMGITYWLE